MNKVKSFTLFTSGKGNRYFHDGKIKKTLLCHPVLYFLLRLKEHGREPEQWFNRLDKSPFDINGYGPVSKEEIGYYLRKYLMLKENGYFGETDQETHLSARLTADEVKSSLANSPILTFEITDRCNLQCEYCGFGKFYNDYDERKNKDLDIAAAKRFLKYLQELWDSPLNISHDRNIYIGFYGGEPLLNFPFIEEIVRYLSRIKLLHNRFSFSMTTNGLLLEKYMDFLAAHDFSLLISMDGDEKNDEYRVLKNGQPAHQMIMRNTQALQLKYPDYFKRKVNFNAVLHNKNSVSEIYHFFKRNFGKYPSIGALNTSGIREDQKKAFWRTYSNVGESLFNSEDYTNIEKDMFIRLPNIQSVSTFLHRKNDFSFENYNELLYPLENAVIYPTGTCVPFSKKIFVTVNGKVLACERIGQQYVLGHINPQSVNIDHEAIAGKYNAWFDKLRKQCNACYNTDLCNQCIFNLELRNKPLVCQGFMNHEDYSHYLSSFLSFIEKKPEVYEKIFKEVVIN